LIPKKPKTPKSEVVIAEDFDYTDLNFRALQNTRWTEEAGLDPRIIQLLREKGISHFTPVQAEAFEPVVSGRDVIGRSRTGTGKTLAFGLPSMTRLIKLMEENGKRDPVTGYMKRGRFVSMVILCPTRELARQVQEELSTVASPLGLFVDVFHGGVSYDPQARALRQGLDILVGTPGRVMDHMNRGNLDLRECNIAVLDEADEMLNMGFAEDVEVILDGVGKANDEKTQCLLFSATTPPWVKQIGAQYQANVVAIDSTGDEGGARVAKTVSHRAIQVPPGQDSRKAILEDIIAVHISGEDDGPLAEASGSEHHDPIAAAAAAKKLKTRGAMQQKIFGKTIVFTETKKDADELVSGGVFKSLTAQALHGDVGQKQRDATLNAFRAGSFNVLVATDVAARGIDISDVDLVIQMAPPRDADTYVHRSGRTGRAGNTGISVMLFDPRQARDIVRIERDLGHGFRFDLIGPPSTEAAMRAAAKTSAMATEAIPMETAQFFREAASGLLKGNLENSDSVDPVDVIAKCLAAISRRSTEIQSRSLLTGELGYATVEMSIPGKRGGVLANDVLFTVSKLSRLSHRDTSGGTFDSDVGKIQCNEDSGTAVFDMGVEDAKRLIEFSKTVDAGGAQFEIIHELEVSRGRDFGRDFNNRGRGGGRGYGGRGGGSSYGGGRGGGGSSGGNRSGGGRYESGRSVGRPSSGGYRDNRGSFNDYGDNRGGDRPRRRFGSDGYSTAAGEGRRVYLPHGAQRRSIGSRPVSGGGDGGW
jgi:ATP-dependent RNA helicase DDX21